MNAALNQLIGVLANGGTHVGDLCWWGLTNANIDRKTLELMWNHTGLASSLLPEPPTLTKAFKLAARETQVGLVDTLIRPVIDDSSSVVFAVVHEQKLAEGFLQYTQEAKIVLDVLQGTLRTDSPAHSLVNAVQMRFDELKNTHTADDVRRTITRTLQSFSSVLLRENGGVWWIPSPYSDALRRLQSCIEGIGSSKMYLLPIHESADAQRTLGDAAQRSLEAELVQLKEEVEAFVGCPPERTSTLVRRLESFDELRARAELYRDVLSIRVADLDVTLDSLSRSIESLLVAKRSS